MKSRFAKGIRSRNRRAEQGQTILLVAVSIVALLAMAALAIDVVTLYVAKSEIQSAADAVALAGAKAIADSGVTTLADGDADQTDARASAQAAATSAINAALAANLVDGQAPTLVSGGTIVWPPQGNNNPTITVTLQQTNLPTFFARIFARTSAMTQAKATAEAYNPANMDPFTPITPVCVKPWLMADVDPTNNPQPHGGTATQLIDPATGHVEAQVNQLIGNPANSFYLTSYCKPDGGQNKCNPRSVNFNVQAGGSGNPPAAYYAAATVIPGTSMVPTSCSAAGSFDPYALDVAGCDLSSYVWTQCGGTQSNLLWDPTENPNNGAQNNDQNADTALGAECLLGLTPPGQTGSGLGQDTLGYLPNAWPAGSPAVTIHRGAQSGANASTSNSIVTIPIIGDSSLNQNRQVTVVGFLQAFINYVGNPVGGNAADLNITVMNVVGCSQTTNGNPAVTGGNGGSTIPVRLITPP